MKSQGTSQEQDRKISSDQEWPKKSNRIKGLSSLFIDLRVHVTTPLSLFYFILFYFGTISPLIVCLANSFRYLY